MHLRPGQRLRLRAAGIRPVTRQRGLPGWRAQQGQRIGQVGIQQRMVLHHRGQRGIADHRRAQRPQAVQRWVVSPLLTRQQPQCHGRIQQALAGRQRQVQQGRQGLGAGGALGQAIKQLQPHTGQQDLAVAEAGHQIKKLPGTAAGDGAGEGEGRRPAPKGRAGQALVTPGAPALQKALRPGGQRCIAGHGVGGGRRYGRGQRARGGSHVGGPLQWGRRRGASGGRTAQAAACASSSHQRAGTRRSDSARTSARRRWAPRQSGTAATAWATSC